MVGDECVCPKRDSGHKESKVEKSKAGPDKFSGETDARPVGGRVR